MVEQINEGLIKLEEGIYVRKSKLGWELRYPIKDPITKKIIRKNILPGFGGSWLKFLIVILILALILFGYFSYMHDMKEGIKCINRWNTNPCIRTCSAQCDLNYSNFTVFNETLEEMPM